MTQDEVSKRFAGGLAQYGHGLLERAWSSQWALRLLCAVLFLDMAMMLRVDRGVSQWEPSDMELLRDVGWLSFVIVAFSFSVAIVIPVVLPLLRHLSVQVWYSLASRLPQLYGSDVRPYQRGLGYVPSGALRDLALLERDDFLFRLYEKHVQVQKLKEAAREQTGALTAAAVLTALVDWIVAQQLPDAIGIVDAIHDFLGDSAPFVTMAVLFCAAFILRRAWFADPKPDYIYYPPLDRILRDKERIRSGI